MRIEMLLFEVLSENRKDDLEMIIAVAVFVQMIVYYTVMWIVFALLVPKFR